MKVSLVQLCSTRDIDANLATCSQLADKAIADGSQWVLFPENAPFLGTDADKLGIAEPLDGPIVDHFRAIARRGDCWVTIGSVPEVSDDPGRTHNTQLLLDPSGDTAAVYRKIHLFDVDLDDEHRYRESDSILAGRQVVSAPVSADGRGHIAGLTVCYDLRFPELYRRLCDQGAEIFTVPSAFTLQTGRDHWHVLLRARAIENQAYVLAPNQWGHHFGRRHSYGHSAIYDPWGAMVACAPDRQCVVTADLDFDYLRGVRQRLPSLEHRCVDMTPDGADRSM